MSANVARHFFARVARVIRLPDGFMLASGMNTKDEVCAAEQEGASRWTRGGAGVASYEETCLKSAADTYAWTQGVSGGTVGLAAHIADTTTHGTTGNIVGTSDTQTLTNKTLTAPTIADFTNMAHDHLDADDGGTLSAAAIASGTIATARLGSGAADSLTFLRGDQTWSSLPVAPGVWPAAFVDAFGSLGTSDGQFTGIRGMTLGQIADVLYVSSDDRIQRFALNGTHDSTIATTGSGDGQVNDPGGLSRSRLFDRLFVADTLNDRVQTFNPSDAYIQKLGTSGTGNGQFADPLGIATYDSGPLEVTAFVVDTGNNRVQALVVGAASLSYDRQWGSAGPGQGQFDSPTGIAVDPEQRVWVADSGNDRVQVFSVDGDFIFEFGESGSNVGQFDSPHSIAIDGIGNAYITDTGNDRVQVFTPEGLFRGFFGLTGTGDGEFNGPTAIAVSDANVYVADSGNNRVQIFINPVGSRSSSLIAHRDQILQHVAFQATSGVTNSSTVTYVDTVNEAITLPAGTWTVMAVWTQAFSATTVANVSGEGRIVVGATNGPNRGWATLNGERTNVSVAETVPGVVSDGATAITVQTEFRRTATFAATPSAETGVLTLTCQRTA